VHAQIIETTSFTEIREAIKEGDKDTLVIFDVKSVLILPQGQDSNSIDRYSPAEREKLYSKILIQLKPALVDPNILNIFADIKSKQIKAIALTSGYTGKFGYIEKREDLRIQKLKEVGISFKDSFSEIKPTIFEDIKKVNPKHYPMFKEGIVFACRLPKGEVLQRFLTQAKFKPKKVIFVDNKLKNIESVQEFCQNAKIDFHGFHYTFLDNIRVSTTIPVTKTNN
jgi:hypothetical protein